MRKRGFPRIQFAPCPQLMCLLVPFQVDLTAHTDSAGSRVLCLLQNQTEQHAGGILQQAVEHEPAMHCGRCSIRAGAVSGRGRCRHVLGAGCLILCDITPRGLLQYRCNRDGGHGNVPLRNGVKGMAVTTPNEISCGMILRPAQASLQRLLRQFDLKNLFSFLSCAYGRKEKLSEN